MTVQDLFVEPDIADGIGEMIVASAAGIFEGLGALANPSAREAAETGEFSAQNWAKVQAAGFPLAMLTEERGGVGPFHALAITRIAGGQSVSLPVAETMAANWLLVQSGLEPTDAPLTFSNVAAQASSLSSGWRVSAVLPDVPFGRNCGIVFPILQGADVKLARLEPGEFSFESGTNIAAEPRDLCRFNAIIPHARIGTVPETIGLTGIYRLGAALRCAQMAGAMEAAVGMTVDYVRERKQFGRALAGFQAVQQLLAQMATQTAAARSAADLVAEAIGDGIEHRAVAIAKIRVGEAAGIVAAGAHQLHGAIGFTREHPLHLLTRRLWSWRDEFGGETEWAKTLGQDIACCGGGAALWPELTGI